jgi:protein-tyrosine phosphatase
MKEFKYKTIEILDHPEASVYRNLPEILEFIKEGIKAGGVLVHW